MKLWRVEHFWTYLSSHLGVIAEYNNNHAQKWGQVCCKSVQLVRVSSFRKDLLQNPYFNLNSISKCNSFYFSEDTSDLAMIMVLILPDF